MGDIASVARSIIDGWRPGDDITFPGETTTSPQHGPTSATVPDSDGAEPTSVAAGNPDTLATDRPDWRNGPEAMPHWQAVDRFMERTTRECSSMKVALASSSVFHQVRCIGSVASSELNLIESR